MKGIALTTLGDFSTKVNFKEKFYNLKKSLRPFFKKVLIAQCIVMAICMVLAIVGSAFINAGRSYLGYVEVYLAYGLRYDAFVECRTAINKALVGFHIVDRLCIVAKIGFPIFYCFIDDYHNILKEEISYYYEALNTLAQ